MDNYRIVAIGAQVWMLDNLNTEYYRDGTRIPEAKTAADWKKCSTLGVGCWCYYNNKKENGHKFGKLYNWYAVNPNNGHGGIAPAGWHIPSINELNSLLNSFGMTTKGEKWSIQDDDGYVTHNNEGYRVENQGIKTNKWGVILGGSRFYKGSFEDWSEGCFWWSASTFDNTSAWGIMADIEDRKDQLILTDPYNKGDGNSVRCVHD